MSQHTPWPVLDRYERELLDGGERLAVEAHVHECSECGAALRRLREEESALREALAPTDEDEDGAEQTASAAAAQLRAPAAPRRLGAFVPLAAAAAVIVAVVVATLPRPPGPDPMTAALTAVERGEPGAEDALVAHGRKCLGAVRLAEASAAGAARDRLAAVRTRLEQALPRILWVEADPRNTFGTVGGALRRDKSCLVQTLVLETKQCLYSERDVHLPFRHPISSFPVHGLDEYDVVILGDFRSSDPTLPQAVSSFVTTWGGGVLMQAGKNSSSAYTECGMVAPVTWVSTERPKTASACLTADGQMHCATEVEATVSRQEYFQSLEPIRWYETVAARPEAQTLVATREGAPLLTVWEAGRGRVAHVATDDFWVSGDRQILFYGAVLNWLAQRR